jgi:predicted nucleic acid-binding protein
MGLTDSNIPVAIVDANALVRLMFRDDRLHKATRGAMESIGHLVVSPMVLAEADYLLTKLRGPSASTNLLNFIVSQVDKRRWSIPDIQPHMHTALTVMEAYKDARGGDGVGLADAVSVVLAEQYRTNVVVTTDSDFRMIRPLSAHDAFRLLPEDL